MRMGLGLAVPVREAGSLILSLAGLVAYAER
jgi:hypothetical protein